MRSHVGKTERNPTHVVEETVATDAVSVWPDSASITADGDDRGERLDAVAGSEFVDDRIREE